jgi:hypothetical protein
MAKMGRPRKKIDQKVFESLCGLQCTLTEICDFFDVKKPTLERWCKDTYHGETFFTVFKAKRVHGKISLRRSMFRLAETNAAVNIFMSKNFLGMRDVPVEEDGGETLTSPVSFEFVVKDASVKKTN